MWSTLQEQLSSDSDLIFQHSWHVGAMQGANKNQIQIYAQWNTSHISFRCKILLSTIQITNLDANTDAARHNNSRKNIHSFDSPLTLYMIRLQQAIKKEIECWRFFLHCALNVFSLHVLTKDSSTYLPVFLTWKY